jgi:hypothetical protein
MSKDWNGDGRGGCMLILLIMFLLLMAPIAYKLFWR